ncbi:hypothetical protein KFK14_12705 [Sphingobium phenoxybenzoativorans]|uniref:Uncharacterized protein n=1 Tax=Sphingobium phenoxybenzoativorans TaxID=1592790 RepID=A0A975K315_9SPHN|nr:hypothetical protein [Sphingobium phenoxybenzoativorans]QUT04006.1 hypothetical protein KFK14_12705 [Sphingobium phenoxybenzoativorans]
MIRAKSGGVYRSEGYGMFTDYAPDFRGDLTIELWRFSGEDDPQEGFGYLEISVHEIVETSSSGTIAIYYRQWFAPDGAPAWGNRRKRVIGSIGSLNALIRRRQMTEVTLMEAEKQ